MVQSATRRLHASKNLEDYLKGNENSLRFNIPKRVVESFEKKLLLKLVQARGLTHGGNKEVLVKRLFETSKALPNLGEVDRMLRNEENGELYLLIQKCKQSKTSVDVRNIHLIVLHRSLYIIGNKKVNLLIHIARYYRKHERNQRAERE